MIDVSRYQNETVNAESEFSGEYALLKMRYKLPGEDTSRLLTTVISKANEITDFENPEQNNIWQNEIGFATAVASFGQILKGGQYTGQMTYDDVITLALETRGRDEFGYRAEFINLVRLTKTASALQAN